jgi:hypothetical protein
MADKLKWNNASFKYGKKLISKIKGKSPGNNSTPKSFKLVSILKVYLIMQVYSYNNSGIQAPTFK